MVDVMELIVVAGARPGTAVRYRTFATQLATDLQPSRFFSYPLRHLLILRHFTGEEHACKACYVNR